MTELQLKMFAWKHLKTGSQYKVLHLAQIENDSTPAVVYQSIWGTRPIWVRPLTEFLDGRFEQIKAMPADYYEAIVTQ